MKWAVAVAVALAVVSVILIVSGPASAQETRDPLIDPGEGGAGARFQIVGQRGWTAGETVTIEFGFSDFEPIAGYNGPFYRTETVTVLRDGTWSFPVVVNDDVLPFPLWRPGFIVVRATSATNSGSNWFVYTVEGRRPGAAPPLAEFGSGPMASAPGVAGIAMLMFGAGALVATAGAIRHPRFARASAAIRHRAG